MANEVAVEEGVEISVRMAQVHWNDSLHTIIFCEKTTEELTVDPGGLRVVVCPMSVYYDGDGRTSMFPIAPWARDGVVSMRDDCFETFFTPPPNLLNKYYLAVTRAEKSPLYRDIPVLQVTNGESVN